MAGTTCASSTDPPKQRGGGGWYPRLWTKEEDAIVLRVVQAAIRANANDAAASASASAGAQNKNNGAGGGGAATFTQWVDLVPKLDGLRTGKQIRDRWVNYLNPALNHEPFDRDDDLSLWRGHEEFGKRWVEISSKVFHSTRSENQIKNRWYSAKFKKAIAREFGADAYVNAELRQKRVQQQLRDQRLLHGQAWQPPKATSGSAASRSARAGSARAESAAVSGAVLPCVVHAPAPSHTPDGTWPAEQSPPPRGAAATAAVAPPKSSVQAEPAARSSSSPAAVAGEQGGEAGARRRRRARKKTTHKSGDYEDGMLFIVKKGRVMK